MLYNFTYKVNESQIMGKLGKYTSRSPGEVVRDILLLAYPEWNEWSRDLKRVFSLLPSYGVGKESLESMCEDFSWGFDKLTKKIAYTGSFKVAVKEFVDNGYQYRTGFRETKSGLKQQVPVKWSTVQHVYMLESGMAAFIKAEMNKVSKPEEKLIEKTGLLDVERIMHETPDVVKESMNGSAVPNYTEGEASLFALKDNINGKSKT